MTKLAFKIDCAVLRKARLRAIEEGTSVSATVREFLEQYAKVGGTPETLQTELPIFKGSTGFQQGINPSSNKSMLQAAGNPRRMACIEETVPGVGLA